MTKRDALLEQIMRDEWTLKYSAESAPSKEFYQRRIEAYRQDLIKESHANCDLHDANGSEDFAVDSETSSD